ncbi:DUF2795 domain-containing protein [Embleya sp. NPDC050154]|uniref:DUF2795 domain-containing protein n=1 Tax=Embleya sp. NPDC050154 TaxID=3363988 RepID=UPI0037A51593
MTTHEHDNVPSGAPEDLVERASGVGGTPSGMSATDVRVRSDLARHLGRDIYPADREALLARLRGTSAPDHLVDLLAGLPVDGFDYESVQQLCRALGLGTEEHHT